MRVYIVHLTVPTRSKRSVLRTIRLPLEIDALIGRDAEQRGVSVNAIVTSALTRYAEWDRFADRFGFITVTRAGHQRMLEAFSDSELSQMGDQLGAVNPRSMILFWYKRLDLETFLRWLQVQSRYGRFGEVEVEREGASAVVSIHHDEGPKNTLWLKHFLTAAVKDVVGVTPKVRTGSSSVVLRIDPP